LVLQCVAAGKVSGEKPVQQQTFLIHERARHGKIPNLVHLMDTLLVTTSQAFSRDGRRSQGTMSVSAEGAIHAVRETVTSDGT